MGLFSDVWEQSKEEQKKKQEQKKIELLAKRKGISLEDAEKLNEKMNQDYITAKNNLKEMFGLDKKEEIKKKVEENKANGIVSCPKCASTSITAQKKGFGASKAVLGAAALGGVGVAAGGIGSNKIEITCLNCGHKWKPGK